MSEEKYINDYTAEEYTDKVMERTFPVKKNKGDKFIIVEVLGGIVNEVESVKDKKEAREKIMEKIDHCNFPKEENDIIVYEWE